MHAILLLDHCEAIMHEFLLLAQSAAAVHENQYHSPLTLIGKGRVYGRKTVFL